MDDFCRKRCFASTRPFICGSQIRVVIDILTVFTIHPESYISEAAGMIFITRKFLSLFKHGSVKPFKITLGRIKKRKLSDILGSTRVPIKIGHQLHHKDECRILCIACRLPRICCRALKCVILVKTSVHVTPRNFAWPTQELNWRIIWRNRFPLCRRCI